MQRINLVSVWISGMLLALPLGTAAAPVLEITKPCREFVPLFMALPPNECFVTSMVTRESDDLIIVSTCGKKEICLFSFDPKSSQVTMLDHFQAPWWDEPRLALGPGGDIYLAARRAFDKQFVFERLRERPQTPDSAYKRRDIVPLSYEVDAQAEGMAIRHYSPDGLHFLRKRPRKR